MDKETIAKNFSRCARTYDAYAGIQNKTGGHLLGLIRRNGFKQILEIGCGTGNYTLLLKNKFKTAKLLSVDISQTMLEQARGKFRKGEIEFNLADAENLSLNRNFDLITSNACFQWFGNLNTALRGYANLLDSEGQILFSIFGPGTFKELNESLRALNPGVSANAKNFITRDRLRLFLKNSFKEIEVDECNYEEDFSCLKELLRKIKYTGTRGEGFGGKILFTREALNRLEDIYLDKYKRIKATYQVFYCGAKK